MSESDNCDGRENVAEDLGTTAQRERSQARKRIEKRRGLQSGFVAYIVVNAFLIGAWAMTGRGYFWPAWVLAGWGMGMLLGLWDYLRGPVTDAEVERELHRKPMSSSDPAPPGEHR